MADTYFLCSHTHWDREWYGEFQQFRMRLVKMVDAMLELLDANPDYRCFNFDGQTIVIEDYLDVRPENRDRLAKYIAEGRIVIGPWHILPDEFLVSGESTVRNLQFGARVASQFGRISNVGYLPDTFGHFSQMPQLLAQWGIDVAILWRGISGDEYKNELVWQAPDGTSVLLARLPEGFGYWNAALFVGSLPKDLREKMFAAGYHSEDILAGDHGADALIAACQHLKSNATANVHLLLNGIDHSVANPNIPDIIARANSRLTDGEIVHGSLDQFATALMQAVDKSNLQIKTGELRDTIWRKSGGGYILNGVLSSRIYLKQQNNECCTLLENWIEPFATFHTQLGAPHETNFIRKAWDWVLKNHPHDSIGGCSVDKVHRQMETRFGWARDICDNLLEFTFSGILEHVKLPELSEGEYAFAVFNPHQHTRSDWLQLEIEIPWPVDKFLKLSDVQGVVITDSNGVEQPCNLLEYDAKRFVNRPTIKTFDPVFRRPWFKISMWASDIPACGYKIFKLKPIFRQIRFAATLSPEPNVLENNRLRAQINPNGTIELTDKLNGLSYSNLLYFEDGGDNGAGYAYSPPKCDKVYTTLASNAEIVLIENSPARAAYKITHTLMLPTELGADKQSRAQTRIPLVIESIVALGVDSQRLDIETTLVNSVKDHRLRVCFPTYPNAEVSSADAQFDVIDHPVFIEQPSREIWLEDQPMQFAQKTFASVSDGKKGLTVASQGLPEYEVSPDTARAIEITLLRAVSHLSNDWKNTRLGLAGPIIPTPDAQMIGRQLSYRYSIIPHAGSWENSPAQLEAMAFNCGLRAYPVVYNSSDAALPAEHSFMQLGGSNIVLSAIKRSEDGTAVVVRFWNSGANESVANLILDRKPKSVYLSNIKEDRLEQLPAANPIEISVPSKRIVTLLI